MSANRKPANRMMRRTVIYATLASFILTSSPGFAATTDIGNAPIASASAVQVLPNVMLILDNSGSMAWEYMPDLVDNYNDKIGFKNHLCNTIYFNPATTYKVPKKPDGIDMAASTFGGAPSNGFQNYPGAPTSTTILSSSFKAHSGDTAQAAYYYEYTGTQALKPDAAGCKNSDTNSIGTYDTNIAATDGGNWQKKKVSAGQEQNFANWYSYYRTRILLMKSASSLAFDGLDNTYRVGFVVIKPNNPITSTYFTPVGKFESTHRSTWFETLFNTSATSYTPLREALARVGRYYAGKSDGINSGMIPDPVQYSCQQNFAILTTDGYWNTNDETVGPVGLNGTTKVGNQDGDANITPRPLFDGASGETRLQADAIVNYNVADCSNKTTTQYFKTVQTTTKTTTAQTGTTQVTKKSATQTLKTATQTMKSTVATAIATTNIIIRQADSGTSVTAINIDGANRLGSTVNASGSNSSSRKSSIASGIASNLTGGYSASAFGTCSSSGNPAGCTSSSDRYVTVLAPSGSGAVTYAVTFGTGGSTITLQAANFSGGGVTSTGPTAVSSCTPGTTTAGNVTTVTTCAPGPNTLAATAVATCSPQTAASGNAWTTITCTPGPNTLAATPVDPITCSAQTAAAGNDWTTIICTPTTTPNTPVDATQCPSSPASGTNNWTAVTLCNAPTVTPTFVATAASCTPAAASASNNWTTTACATSIISNVPFKPTGTSSCSASNGTSSNSWQETTCPSVVTGPEVVASCSSQTAGSGNNWTKIACATNASYGVLQYQTKETDITTIKDSNGNLVTGYPKTTTTWLPSSTTFANQTGVCEAPRPTAPASGNRTTVDILTPPAGCTGWPCDITYGGGAGGSSDTLADVAQYYYRTDLRPDMIDDVPGSGVAPEDDTATWQHMTTFTMGLGVSGTLVYTNDYKTTTDTANDFYRIRKGDITKPTTNGTVNWSVPSESSTGPAQLDDLWHAAVNGRGQFFSADNPDSVIDSLKGALAGIKARKGSAAAAATSNLEPVAGDNFAYTASYTTVDWTGELEAHEIDLTTGTVLPAVVWSAMTELDKKRGDACDDRRIVVFRAGATDNLVNFTWDTDTCVSGAPAGSPTTALTTEKAYFDLTSVSPALNQWSLMSGTQKTAATGANLVNFIRGQKGKEGFVANNDNSLYRTRKHVLGDIVNAQPVFVKAPFAAYEDAVTPTYSTFKTAQKDRVQLVYAASNDGMLHAFFAGTTPSDKCCGQEAWAFIPTMVLKNLYRLADYKYDVDANHVYSVDGTPAVGDFYDDRTGQKTWKTLLVGGLNGGGNPSAGNQGFYALDITDPENPKGMWEFKRTATCAADPVGESGDCHIGYTFGNPIISKIKDGTATGKWVVFLTSGYNNDDGNGYLYVLDAATGTILYRIATGASTDALNPSGLNHALNWVDNTLSNNLTERVYGVDLLGNVWRFDVNDTIGPSGREAALIGTAKAPAPDGTPQSITTRPELAEVGGKPMVFVATGRLLHSNDTSNTQKQSIYGIIDDLSKPTAPATAVYADLRGAMKPLALSLKSGTTDKREVACTGTDEQCASTSGWVVDLPDTGERVNVDMKLQLGTLVVASNVPSEEGCTVGGYSWLNYLNFSTGTAVSNSGGVAGERLSSSLAVGLNIVRLPDGKTVVITTTSDAQQKTIAAPFDTPPPTGKRISWRELSQ